MSRASKLTLLGTSAFAVVTVVFVHFQQDAAMHQGVVRDMEQQRVKRERQLDFDLQRVLEEEYRKEQTVRDVTAEMSQAEVTGAGTTTASASPAEIKKNRGLWLYDSVA
ncbi:hypothetical protein CMQ_1550 [Grosmannia clavigera kw1407]|uniref:Cytochrome c oxidase assembly protein n=1 Tax=Grosmannia clavigera (strain kw1407 / UAMH 11150) TaxID=655863 RepID=F0XDY1_GROCL|nr:uncharacterized protein CMQ_1550 [Grosmannia clavigera kw1407]EFX04622.1 hypothetical protein CMQ_1550 [Grosmannia clavigera kw1407]